MQYVKIQKTAILGLQNVKRNRNFAVVNGISFYILLLCFASGIASATLLLCGLFMFWKHRTYQFQKVFAVVVILHSVGFLNNFLILNCWDKPFSVFFNMLLLLFDYVIVGGYMAFSVSLIFPNRYKNWQLFLLVIPYIAAMILFAFTKHPSIYPIIQIYTVVVSLALMIYLGYSIRRHTQTIRENTANLEYFDLRWSAYLLLIYFAVQIVWAFESISQKNWFASSFSKYNLLFDTIYCFIMIFVVIFTMRKIIQQKVLTITEEEDKFSPENEMATDPIKGYKSLIYNDIDKTIVEKQYYKDPSLTLQKLAKQLGTNRQYLSNFINQEKHQTFYDYINEFRLEEVKAMIDAKGPDNKHSLEDIAVLSGFNSYATFLRSFKKKYGKTPSQYLADKESRP